MDSWSFGTREYLSCRLEAMTPKHRRGTGRGSGWIRMKPPLDEESGSGGPVAVEIRVRRGDGVHVVFWCSERRRSFLQSVPYRVKLPSSAESFGGV